MGLRLFEVFQIDILDCQALYLWVIHPDTITVPVSVAFLNNPYPIHLNTPQPHMTLSPAQALSEVIISLQPFRVITFRHQDTKGWPMLSPPCM
jgi:hypothetical protein